MSLNRKTAIIIGAGPAGLTAAYELLKHTDIKPVIYEAGDSVGGIAKTVDHRGNLIDVGGHRFFSKSERVISWWLSLLPLQGKPSKDDRLLGRQISLSEEKDAPDPEQTDLVMLVRRRLSRIYFIKKFFDYPISLNWDTVKKMGSVRLMRIIASYARVKISPVREKSLEDFYINRFGAELYKIFFKEYTEKLWGIPCRQLPSDWGAQRVKGLSMTKAVGHAFKSIFIKSGSKASPDVETSLIDSFYYPKLGVGQMWERAASLIRDMGGEIHLGREAVGFRDDGKKVSRVSIKSVKTGETSEAEADYFFSTMPIKDLISGFDRTPPEVREVANDLRYRDFITVGLLLHSLKIKNQTEIKTLNSLIPDTWIYIQEPDVKMCRFQIFNNWSPYLVRDSNNAWLGLEYVCNEGDDLWNKSQDEMIAFATSELEKMDIADKREVIDATVVKVKKAYPSYAGSFDKMGIIKNYVNRFENLYLIGRNGLHRYNNMDHSMLTAMTAVDNIKRGISDKDSIWDVNAEKDYHESK